MPRLKGPVPQVQAKEGPMPQLVKKRRSGWAVLAVGALVASILAVGASPAAAAPRQPDQEATWKACLGPAMAERGFTDVSASGNASHYDNINCLAYYEITKGRTADTFAPGANVTRSQMALFLNRAADAAGIDLGDAEDQGFTDLDADDTERFDAINRLVGAGIMFGDTETSFDPPSTTVFAPADHVTRWEMALFLFAFLDHALESVLIDELPKSVDGDNTGRVELGSDDGYEGDRPDDYFRDARRQTPAHVDDRISAMYELGITTGTNGMVGEKGTYNPNGLVTRAQMASFIMRTMGHTNLRPAGLTSQSTDENTQVSVRDADFVPIGDVRTEVFTSNFPDSAFNANGACIGRYVERQDPGFAACEIDHGDRLTDGETGNAFWPGVGLERGNHLVIVCAGPDPVNPTGVTASDTYRFMAGTRGSDTDYTIYAWSSSIGDEATADDLFKSVPANVLTELTEAEKFIVTGQGSGSAVALTGDQRSPGINHPAGPHFKMGQTVTFTVQLLDEDGDPVGPTPGENNLFEVKVDTFRETALPDNAIPDPPVGTEQLIGDNAGIPVVENSPSAYLTGEVYENVRTPPDRTAVTPQPTDPLNVHGRDDVVDVIASFPTGVTDLDFTRTRAFREPDSSGQFTLTVSYRDSTRLINNADALIQVTITPVPGNALEPRDGTMPRGQGEILATNGVQLPDVRFSDNAPIVTAVLAGTADYRLRSPSNRNSISASLVDQYGDLYRGGEYEIVASDVDHDGLVGESDGTEGIDFPHPFAVSRSGRRSLGYNHTGVDPERQDAALQLWLPVLWIAGGAYAATDNPATPYVNEANIQLTDDPLTPYVNESLIVADDPETPGNQNLVRLQLVTGDGVAADTLADDEVRRVTGVVNLVTVYWTDLARGRSQRVTMGLPILIGDPSANLIIVDLDGDVAGLNLTAEPGAYPYGPDDNFVVEGASVTMDQFEEILAQHDPYYVRGGLIESLGELTWTGYDYNRPNDGATWTITRLSCRMPPRGD